MLKIKKKMKVSAKIPDSSMSDIAFLLIVFFMVTTTFTKDKTPVELPSSVERVELPKDAIIVTITHEGIVKWDSKETAITQLQNLAEYVIAQNPSQYFIIKADKKVKYVYIDEIMEQLRRAKVINISLPTTREGKY